MVPPQMKSSDHINHGVCITPGSSSGPTVPTMAHAPRVARRPKRSASCPIGSCRTTFPARNTVTSSSAARSPRWLRRPNTGSSDRSADSTMPAMSAASITDGAAAASVTKPGVDVVSRLASGTCRTNASGTAVNARVPAPTTKGVSPTVPVNSSRSGPATTPAAKTVAYAAITVPRERSVARLLSQISLAIQESPSAEPPASRSPIQMGIPENSVSASRTIIASPMPIKIARRSPSHAIIRG